MAVAVLAKGLYLVMLREAAKIAGLGGLRSSPRKVRKTSAGSSSLCAMCRTTTMTMRLRC